MRTKQGAIGKDFGKVMNQYDKRLIRFRICDHKKHVLEIYNRLIILLNGNLERLIGKGKEGEVLQGLIDNVQTLIEDVDGVNLAITGKRYFVTDEPEKEADNEN